MSVSEFNDYVMTHSYVWSTLESLYFIGLCLLFGSLLLIDLRALGVAQTVPFSAVENVVHIAGVVKCLEFLFTNEKIQRVVLP